MEIDDGLLETVQRICSRVAGSTNSEDFTQDVWVECIRWRNEHGNTLPEVALIRRMARCRFYSSLRRKGREKWKPLPDTLATNHASPRSRLEEDERKQQVDEAILSLPKREQEVLLPIYFEGRTGADVARQSGVPAETIRTRHSRALATLRLRLQRTAID